MKNKIIFCDCLVVGAGVSGVVAAIASSRKGIKTILLERNNFPGGTAVTAMHRYLCGVNTKRDGMVKEIIQGIAPDKKLIRMGRVLVLPFKTKRLIDYLQRIIKKEDNLKAIYNARAVSVTTKNNRIVSVSAKSSDGRIKVYPKVVIEASGNGQIIRLSKAKYNLTEQKKRQLSGFSIKINGVKDKDSLLGIKIPYYIKFSNFYYGDILGEAFIKFSLVATKNISINKYAKTKFVYLKKMVPELARAYIEKTSPEIAEREGIRILGKYVLTKSDVLKARKFNDSITRNSWPIEFWDPQNGPKLEYLKPGQYYEIPERCLKSKNITNLIATGKCISATPEALASTRVIGTCIALGEAAGILASRICAQNKK